MSQKHQIEVLFAGMRGYLSAPYRDWDFQRFVQESASGFVPPDFGFQEKELPFLGVLFPEDSKFLWKIMQMLSWALCNHGELKSSQNQGLQSLSWPSQVENVSLAWIEVFKTALVRPNFLLDLAIYPEAASRLVARVLVEACGFPCIWEYTSPVQQLWIEVTRILLQPKISSIDVDLSDREVLEIQDSVNSYGFEETVSNGYSHRRLGYTQMHELFRLSWSLSRRGMIPSPKGEGGVEYIKPFWDSFMHDTFPKAVLSVFQQEVHLMPIQLAAHPNNVRGWIAMERLHESS